MNKIVVSVVQESYHSNALMFNVQPVYSAVIIATGNNTLKITRAPYNMTNALAHLYGPSSPRPLTDGQTIALHHTNNTVYDHHITNVIPFPDLANPYSSSIIQYKT